jgi:lipopolysaccharide heptosyltransferase I
MAQVAFETPPRRILLVKPSALGDVVHALPVAALIRRRGPEAHLAWLISRPFAPLLETNPHVNEPITFDRERGGGLRRHSKNAQRLRSRLRESRFDLVIDLQGLFRSGWLTWGTRAPVRVGFSYAREGAQIFYTHRVPGRPGERHAIERYLDVADALGLGRDPVEFPLHTLPQDEDGVGWMLGTTGADRYAVLLPGTNWATKRWPAQYFAELARRLDRELNLRPVVAGADDAISAAHIIRSWHADALDLVGKTNVRELTALLRNASLVVSNDSGPMHLAAALGVPLVAPFGPTSPLRTGPYQRGQGVVRLDLVCEPCFSRTCLHQTCLVQLDTDALFRRCAEVLRSASSPLVRTAAITA